MLRPYTLMPHRQLLIYLLVTSLPLSGDDVGDTITDISGMICHAL